MGQRAQQHRFAPQYVGHRRLGPNDMGGLGCRFPVLQRRRIAVQALGVEAQFNLPGDMACPQARPPFVRLGDVGLHQTQMNAGGERRLRPGETPQAAAPYARKESRREGGCQPGPPPAARERRRGRRCPDGDETEAEHAEHRRRLDHRVGEGPDRAHEVPGKAREQPAAQPFRARPGPGQDQRVAAAGGGARAAQPVQKGRGQGRKQTEYGREAEHGDGDQPAVAGQIDGQGMGNPERARRRMPGAEPPAVGERPQETPTRRDQPDQAGEGRHQKEDQMKRRQRPRRQQTQRRGEPPPPPARQARGEVVQAPDPRQGPGHPAFASLSAALRRRTRRRCTRRGSACRISNS